MNRRSNGMAVCVVALSAALVSCSTGTTTTPAGPLPGRESANIAAGVDAIPADARLSLDATTALGGSGTSSGNTTRKAYADHTKLALGLINRYLLTPYAKGKFTVTADAGPGSKTLGRAAAATTAAVTALDLAIPDAPTNLRQPTLFLLTQLTRIDHALRAGATLAPTSVNSTNQLILALQTASKADHLTLRPSKAPDLTPVTVVPQWRAALKVSIHEIRTLTNSALGAIRRYIQRPVEQGKFSTGRSPKSIRRTQHRAAEALDFAIVQLAGAARGCTGIARLIYFRAGLLSARQTLRRAAQLAYGGRLHTSQASSALSTIDLLQRAGVAAHLKVHPGRSPTFRT